MVEIDGTLRSTKIFKKHDWGMYTHSYTDYDFHVRPITPIILPAHLFPPQTERMKRARDRDPPTV